MLTFAELDELLDKVNDQKTFDGAPPPTSYTFRNYMDDATTNKHGWAGDAHKPSNTDLKPLEPEDMMRYAATTPEELPDYYAGIQQMQLRVSDKVEPLPAFFDLGVRPDYDNENLEKMTGLKW